MKFVQSVTVSIVLALIMAEANGYHYLKDVVKYTQTAAEHQLRGAIVQKPIYSCDGPVIDISNLSWENFDQLDVYTKVSVASAERVANKTDAEGLVQGIIQNPILKPDYDIPIEREDKFIPEKRGWFDFLTGQSESNHLDDIKQWYRKVVQKNVYLKKFGPKFINTVSKLSLSVLKDLKNTCENVVKGSEDEVLMDLKILELLSPDQRHVHVHMYKLKAWADCESSDNVGGLLYIYTKYSFTARKKVVDKINPAVIEKAVTKLQTFLKEAFGERPNPETTTKATPTTPLPPPPPSKPTTTTTTKKPATTAAPEKKSTAKPKTPTSTKPSTDC